MSSDLRLVIFDLDGTLVDSLGSIYLCISDTLDRHGLDQVSEDFVREGIGLGLHEAWVRIAPDADHGALTETYKDVFLQRRARGEDRDNLFDGAQGALRVLDRNEQLLAIATNKGRPGVFHVLEQHGIKHHFSAIRSAHDGPVKPHPDAVHDVLAQTGVALKNAVFIGDTETDMLTASNAGIPAIGVGWGYHSEDRLRQSGATHVAEHFSDVPRLVEQILDR